MGNCLEIDIKCLIKLKKARHTALAFLQRIMREVNVMNDNDVQKRLIEALDNLDKTVNNLSKTMNRMIDFCSLMLLVLFGVVVVALIF